MRAKAALLSTWGARFLQERTCFLLASTFSTGRAGIKISAGPLAQQVPPAIARAPGRSAPKCSAAGPPEPIKARASGLARE